MPIYEFECSECHAVEEILQKVSDPAPEVCPKCEKHSTLHKRVSHTSFQLKGGGWYNDLYASPKTESAQAATKEAAPAPAKTEPSSS